MMKKLLSILTIFTASFAVNAQNVNIPDANFKAILVANPFMNPNGDSEISVYEANNYSGGIGCSNSSISNLTGIEEFTAITSLNCSGNSLTTIDISNNVLITDFRCYNNSITSLDVSQNLEMTDLYCHDNSISTIAFGQNIDLDFIDGRNNVISNLINLNQVTSLKYLYLDNNLLTSLDVSQNSGILNLYCDDNSLTSIDVSQNTSIYGLHCKNNSLLNLNIANGNNSNFYDIFTTGNPNLTCIQVDDVAYSTANWTTNLFDFDATASFSTMCASSVLVNSITVQGQGGVSTISTQGGTLQMEATVLPANADDATYTWSVVPGSGTANVSTSGLLTAITDGTVDVVATANDGSGITGMSTVTISNQTVGLIETTFENLKVYPNPVQNKLSIELEGQQITEINILNLSGKVVKVIADESNAIDVSALTEGVYILKVSTETGIATSRFIKQ